MHHLPENSWVGKMSFQGYFNKKDCKLHEIKDQEILISVIFFPF